MISCELTCKSLAFYANLLALSESPNALSVCISNAISKALLRRSAKHKIGILFGTEFEAFGENIANNRRLKSFT